MTSAKHIVAVAAVWMAAGMPAGPAAQQATPSGSGAPAPAVELPKMKIDLGRVFERDTYEYLFAVRNRGNANLVIDVKPGCGCTAAHFDTVIAPGKEGKIELVLDGHKVHGEFIKQAAVETNDPKHPQMTITLAGFKIPYLEITPPGGIFLQGYYGEKVEKELKIVSNEKDVALKVTGVTSDIDDKITYAVEPGAQKGEYTLRVRKNPKLPTMSTYGSLIVHTNSKNMPDATLQVQVMAKGSINVSPNFVDFGPVKFGESAPGKPVQRYLLVTKTTMGPFKIKDVTVSNPNFAAVVDPITEGQEYRISLTFTPPVKKQPRQSEKAEMIIHTDDEMEPAIRVQVQARTL